MWREKEYPIIHIQHLSDNDQSIFHPSKKSSDFKDIVVPIKDEKIFKKKVNSAFIGTGLEEHLKENKKSRNSRINNSPLCINYYSNEW